MEGENLELHVLEMRKRVLGENHPDTLLAMANLAFTLKPQSRTQEAIFLMETCIKLRKQILHHDHPDTKSSIETVTEWQIEYLEIGE